MENNNKKRKKSPNADNDQPTDNSTQIDSDSSNALFDCQDKFLNSLPSQVRNNFFSDNLVNPDTRAEVWERQATLGESLVNQYSWATPDSRALKIIKHFEPIIEIGCGANAYWAQQLMHQHGVNVLAFDSQLQHGGLIDTDETKNLKKDAKSDNINHQKNVIDTKTVGKGLLVRKGGPEVLSSNKWYKDEKNRTRTLFLCYPDEDFHAGVVDNNDEEEKESLPTSMAIQCLEHFRGDTVIHVGELFGHTLTIDRAPWGRSSSPEFQERLAQDYHCILRATIPNWLHARDTISVWKRTQRCSIVFQSEEGDDESDFEDEYKHIPPEEALPVDVAAPIVKHLLS